MLDELGLDQVINQAGGLAGEQNWEKVMSLSEQQFLALAKCFWNTKVRPAGSSRDDVGFRTAPENTGAIVRAFEHLHQHRKKAETSAIFIKRLLNAVKMVGGPGRMTHRSIVITDRL
ncbi:hypothetical protein ACN2CC_15440 [Mesorhizobium muleiense]|uniref:hypothetical protein n=1 Tax=Mesorhizobium muleiense TaxID=1004279 RepID=UPI003AFB6829